MCSTPYLKSTNLFLNPSNFALVLEEPLLVVDVLVHMANLSQHLTQRFIVWVISRCTLKNILWIVVQ
jgi:hypothetical protein